MLFNENYYFYSSVKKEYLGFQGSQKAEGLLVVVVVVGGGQGRMYHLPVALDSHSQLLWLDRQNPYRKNSWGRNVINKLEGETGRKDQRS